jgi:hypothetical protein
VLMAMAMAMARRGCDGLMVANAHPTGAARPLGGDRAPPKPSRLVIEDLDAMDGPPEAGNPGSGRLINTSLVET